EKARQRRSQPQDRNLISPSTQVLVDGAHVRHLQPPAKLDAEKAKTHVPDLPEAALRLLHGLTPARDQRHQRAFGYRSYIEFNSRNRPASSAVKTPGGHRHRQFPLDVPGRFMRAWLPSPRTSCSGIIAVFATEARIARITAQ